MSQKNRGAAEQITSALACSLSLKQLNNTLPSSSGYQRGNRRQEIKSRSRTKGQAGAQPGAGETLLPGRPGRVRSRGGAGAAPSPSGSVGLSAALSVRREMVTLPPVSWKRAWPWCLEEAGEPGVGWTGLGLRAPIQAASLLGNAGDGAGHRSGKGVPMCRGREGPWHREHAPWPSWDTPVPTHQPSAFYQHQEVRSHVLSPRPGLEAGGMRHPFRHRGS